MASEADERAYQLTLHGGHLNDVSEETFERFQKVMSQLLKESGAGGLTISRPTMVDRSLMIDMVEGP